MGPAGAKRYGVTHSVAMETTSHDQADLETVLTGDDILAFQQLVKKVYVPRNVAEFAVSLVRSTRPGDAKCAP